MKEQKSNPMARIWEIAKPEHGRLLLSVVLAVLGVAAGIVPFVSAAKVISGMISGNREWSYYLVYVIARRDTEADLCQASENAAWYDH